MHPLFPVKLKNSTLTEKQYIRQRVEVTSENKSFLSNRNENYKAQDFWKFINSDFMTTGKIYLAVFMYDKYAMWILDISSFDGLCQG